MNTSNKVRIRRSEKLLPEEKRKFEKFVDSFDTKIDAAEFFGFSTVTLDAIKLKGSGKPQTISMIREKLKQVA